MNLNEKIRSEAIKLAMGDVDNICVSFRAIEEQRERVESQGKQPPNINASYIRSIVSRVHEIAERDASISVSQEEVSQVVKVPIYLDFDISDPESVKASSDAGIQGYEEDEKYYTAFVVRLVDRPSRKRKKASDNMERIAGAKALVKKIDGIMPDVTHLEGEALTGAVEGIRLMKEQIRNMIGE